jgi:hypothetical protein
MDWKPLRKSITNVVPIAIRQALVHGGVSLHLPIPLSFSRRDWLLSLGRTRTLQAAIPGMSQRERQCLVASIGREVATYLDLFIDNRSVEFSFTEKLDILQMTRELPLRQKSVQPSQT